MENLFPFIRTLHVLSASLWIGEVLVINLVLVPVIEKYSEQFRREYLISIFPRIFNLASVLSVVVVVTGVFLVYYMTNGNFKTLLSSSWGLSILTGGSLGIILTLFHFFMENRLARKIGLGREGNTEQLVDVHVKLRIVPRLGLIVILTIFLLMVNAARGILTGPTPKFPFNFDVLRNGLVIQGYNM